MVTIRTQRGFTLIEMGLSIALLAVIAGIGVPVYQALQVRNYLDVAATSLTQDYRRAQVLSQASQGDSSWGVHVDNIAGITLFKGTGYATRDASYDEVYSIPASISITGLLSVVFSRLTGLPQMTGTTTFTSNTNEGRTVHINTEGTVSY